MEEEEASAELISPRISFSHDLAAFAATAACPTTMQPEPRRSDTSLMPRRRRRRVQEPEFDFANAAAADVAPADRLFADGKLLPVPPLPPTAPHARCAKPPQAGTWQRAPRSWASPFARSSSVNSARTAAASAASGRFTCPAFPLMRSRSTGSAAATVGAHQRPHCKKVAPTTTTTASASNNNGGNGAARSVYYYGYGGGRNAGDGHGGGGVRVSPVLNVTSIGTSVVNMLSHLLCDCGEKDTKQQSRGFGVRCWVAR